MCAQYALVMVVDPKSATFTLYIESLASFFAYTPLDGTQDTSHTRATHFMIGKSMPFLWYGT